MKQYIQRFGDLKRKLQAVGVLLPEDYVAQRLLERARLWPQEETAVLGACNQEYAWDPIVKQLVFMFPDKTSLVRRRDPSGSAEGGAGARTPRVAGRGVDGRWKPRIKIGARVSPGATGGQGQPFQRRAYVAETDYDEESDGPPAYDEDEEADMDSAAAEAYMQEGVGEDGWNEEDYALEDIPEEELLNDLPQEFWQDEECVAAALEALDTKNVFTASSVKLRGLMKARGFFPTKGKGKGKGGNKSKGRGKKGADPATVLAMAKRKMTKPRMTPQEILDRKKTSECGVCGKIGHWKGYSECPGPPGGKGNYAAIVSHELQGDEEAEDGEPEWSPVALASYNVPASPFHSWLTVHEEASTAAPSRKPGVLNLRGGGGDSENESTEMRSETPSGSHEDPGRQAGRRSDYFSSPEAAAADLIQSKKKAPNNPFCRSFCLRPDSKHWPCHNRCIRLKNHDGDCFCTTHGPEQVDAAQANDAFSTPEQPISVLVSVVGEALGCMVIDTACQKFVTGSGWLEDFAQRIQAAGIEIILGQEYEVFKFGAGGPQVSRTRARAPAGVNKRTFECRMSVCRGLLPCLASIVACEALGLVLDLHRGCAYFLKLGPERFLS